MTASVTGLVLLCLLATGTVSAAGAAEPPVAGTLCIGRPSVPEQIAGPMDRHKATTDTVFEIRVDKRPPVEITHRRGAVVRELSRSDRHLVAVRSQGELLESFWFRFEPEDPPELCLWYKPDYGYWSFMPDERRILCSCRDEQDRSEPGDRQP